MVIGALDNSLVTHQFLNKHMQLNTFCYPFNRSIVMKPIIIVDVVESYPEATQ